MATKEATVSTTNRVHFSSSETGLELNNNLFSPANYQSIDTALRSIFPTPAEETKVEKARAILQEVATDLSDQEVEIFVTEMQCLIDSWLDVYEKTVFDGLTLKEILHGA